MGFLAWTLVCRQWVQGAAHTEPEVAGPDTPLERMVLNNIANRCQAYIFKCSEAKLLHYQRIIREMGQYYQHYSPYPGQLGINAKYAVLSNLVKRRFHELGFVGFYTVESFEGRERLEVGPYASNITAIHIIEIGKGVCGESWARRETLIVKDVTKHPNYIACDSVTMSEIVVPYFDLKGNIRAVFDIDADFREYFEETDRICLEELVNMMNY